MQFTRALYEDSAGVFFPTLEKIEHIYERLLKMPQQEEVQFSSPEEHKAAANHGDMLTLSQNLMIDTFSFLKFFSYTNTYKTVKLIEGLVHAYNSQNHLVWMLLARSTIENSAIFYYFKKKADQIDIHGPTFKINNLQAFEELMVKFVHGSRFNWTDLLAGNVQSLAETYASVEEQPSAVNVLTAISHLKKRDSRFNDIEVFYGMLSDFAHPNRASHSAVIAMPSTKEPLHRCMITTDPGQERGAFMIAASLQTVHLHLSNIFELVLEVSETIKHWSNMMDGHQQVSIDYTG